MAINIIDPNAPGQAHVDSYWAATGGPEVDGAAPAGDMEVDIAIVGGGYTGLSTALHLGRKFGLKSHVLEANRIGWGCSGRNGGFATLGIGKTSMAGWIGAGAKRRRAASSINPATPCGWCAGC